MEKVKRIKRLKKGERKIKKKRKKVGKQCMIDGMNERKKFNLKFSNSNLRIHFSSLLPSIQLSLFLTFCYFQMTFFIYHQFSMQKVNTKNIIQNVVEHGSDPRTPKPPRLFFITRKPRIFLRNIHQSFSFLSQLKTVPNFGFKKVF